MGSEYGSPLFKIAFVVIVATFCRGVLQLKKNSVQKDTAMDLDCKKYPIQQEECAVDDEDENSEYHEEEGDMENNIVDISQNLTTTVTVGNGGLAAKSGGRPHESCSKLDMQSSELPEVCDAGLKFFSCIWTCPTIRLLISCKFLDSETLWAH